MMMTTLYISGPMTGLPDFNYPAFNETAHQLEAAGFVVINPADAPERDNWLEYRRHALTLLAQADAICSLPGWENSRGACIEHAIMSLLGLPARPLSYWLQRPQNGGRCMACQLLEDHTDDCPTLICEDCGHRACAGDCTDRAYESARDEKLFGDNA
jgi:hypothetical protein